MVSAVSHFGAKIRGRFGMAPLLAEAEVGSCLESSSVKLDLFTHFGLLGGSGSLSAENSQSRGSTAPKRLWFSLLASEVTGILLTAPPLSAPA